MIQPKTPPALSPTVQAPKYDCDGIELKPGQRALYIPGGVICKVKRHWAGMLMFVFPDGHHLHYAKRRGKSQTRNSGGKFPSHKWRIVSPSAK